MSEVQWVLYDAKGCKNGNTRFFNVNCDCFLFVLVFLEVNRSSLSIKTHLVGEMKWKPVVQWELCDINWCKIIIICSSMKISNIFFLHHWWLRDVTILKKTYCKWLKDKCVKYSGRHMILNGTSFTKIKISKKNLIFLDLTVIVKGHILSTIKWKPGIQWAPHGNKKCYELFNSM